MLCVLNCLAFGLFVIDFPAPTDGPHFDLIADGERLYVRNVYNEQKYEFDVKAGKPGPIHERYKLQEDGKTGILTIDDGHGLIERRGNSFSETMWIPATHTAYFVSASDDGLKKSLMQWNRNSGFKAIFTTTERLYNSKVSLDGKYVTITADKGDNSDSRADLVCVNLSSLAISRLPINGHFDDYLMIKQGEFLVNGWDPYIWNRSTGEKRSLEGIELMHSIRVFDGRVWGIGNGDQAVRLDPSLRKVDLTVPFSAEFVAKAYSHYKN